MGKLIYGAARFEVSFDDRVLAHLQIVMTAKLRRTEAFILSWTNPSSTGGGRQLVWVTPYTDLHYAFSGNSVPTINREWLQDLAAVANTAHGLFVTEEGEVEPLPDPSE
ncbi:DUF7882 family protein [Marisediminicola senii]|uniref:DUF7882 family protein n=1 Tax=Marisediminicola senii TaxID=2711233 RepID=UPI0013ED59B6|nr:hypothetical protein [Marisediminicola senii]